MSGNALPRTVLHTAFGNVAGRYVPQLQRITIKCCKSRKDSYGVREYIEHHLVDFARNNPATAVYIKPRRHRPPLIVAEYLCGNWQYVKPRNMSCEEIYNWMNFLRTRSGVDILPIYKYWSTKNPSIQGMWHPFYDSLNEGSAWMSSEEIVKNLKVLSEAEPGSVPSAEEKLLDIAKLQKLRISDAS